MQHGTESIEGELKCILDGHVGEAEKVSTLSLPRADAWIRTRSNASNDKTRALISMAEVIEVLSCMGLVWTDADAWSEQFEVFIPNAEDFEEVVVGFFPSDQDADRRAGIVAQFSEDASLGYRSVVVVTDAALNLPVAMMVYDRYLLAQGNDVTFYKKIHEYGASEPKYEQVLDAVFSLQQAFEVRRVEVDMNALDLVDVKFEGVVGVVPTSGASAERLDLIVKGTRNLLSAPSTPAVGPAGIAPH